VRIGVFASHEGTTLQAVVDACAAKAIPCQVVAVISNHQESGALRRAQTAGIRGYHLSSRTHPDSAGLDAAICQALVESATDVILLAGYMKQIGPETLSRFRGRILNTHPALLPKFGGRGMYGHHVHRAVLAAGEAKSGASVHVVSGGYDAGPILAEAEVRVEPTDTPETLAERVQGCERSLVIEVLGGVATGRVLLPPAEEEGRLTTRFSGPATPAAQRECKKREDR